MAGKFEVYQDKAGEFRFRLKAGNGENILASEGYGSREACINAIQAVKKNANDEIMFERKITSSGKFMFTLKANNHQVIGVSQSYVTASGRDNGIESVKKNAYSSPITEF